MRNDLSLSTMFCDKITSPYNQDESLMIVGSKGSGKSSAAIYIAVETAKKVAKVKGGKWQDYFNLDNIAVITQDEVIRVMKIRKKFSILIMDDIGVGWNSRKWQGKANQALNDIFQTFRTENMLVIVTLPDSMLIDKVPRHLVHYFMEMAMAIFERGITVAKVFEIIRKHRLSKAIHHEYITINGCKIKRHTFHRASDEIMIPYEEKRKRIQKEMAEERLQTIEDEGKEKEPRALKKDIVFEIDRDVKEGIHKDFTSGVHDWNTRNPDNTITRDYAYKVRNNL